MVVADVQDAFWLMPNTRQERLFVATMLKQFIMVFNRAAQEGRGASLSFCTFIALVARCVQSLLYIGYGSDARSAFDLLLQVYVRDPWAVRRGTPARRHFTVATLMSAWLIICLPMAFHKATRDVKLNWIGVTLILDSKNRQVKAEITDD